jgi:hypothetical protein
MTEPLIRPSREPEGPLSGWAGLPEGVAWWRATSTTSRSR